MFHYMERCSNNRYMAHSIPPGHGPQIKNLRVRPRPRRADGCSRRRLAKTARLKLRNPGAGVDYGGPLASGDEAFRLKALPPPP